MEAFLGFARKSWFNYAWSLGMGIAPIVALVLLWDDPAPPRSCSLRSASVLWSSVCT